MNKKSGQEQRQKMNLRERRFLVPLIALGLFILTLSIMLFTLTDIGVTIDEPYKNRTAAQLFVRWIELSIQDILNGNWQHFSSQEVIESYFHPPYVYHPPFARILTGITWKLFHKYLGELAALRLCPAMLFSLSVALLFTIIAEHFGLASGMVSALALLFIPATFGHAHLIALDSPIASMWFFTVFCFIKGLRNWRWSLILGIIWGFSLNTKIHAYFIPLPLFLWSLLYQRNKFQNNFFALFFISPLILFASNPYLWHDTLSNLRNFLFIMADRKELYSIPTFFLGKRYDYSLPWFYPFYMILITIPPVLVVSYLIGAVGSMVGGRKLSSSASLKDSLGMLFLFNVVVSLGLAALNSAPNYDGVRLFLPAFPFLAGLAGMGFHYLSRITSGIRFKKTKDLLLIFSLLLPPAYSLAVIHPYELSYFNSFIGGVQGARAAGLEITYWNDPFNPEFVRVLNQRFKGKSFRPHAANDKNFDYYHELGLLRKDITYSYEHYDYFLVAFRYGWFDAEHWFYAKYIDPIYSVTVEGTPLLSIYKSLETIPFQLNPLQGIPGQKGEWRGLIKIPEEGFYQLAVLSGTRVQIFLDGKARLKVEPSIEPVFRETRIYLEEGGHLFKARFMDTRNPALFYLAWETPSGERGVISPEYLFRLE